MKINQNISAVIVNDQLLRNENALSQSVKKLSSGFKFNDAKDNPSGIAISFKMQAQINALHRASLNATDGTSMVETIDGAMGEMTEILQRMRELCVQAASDTNTPEDLQAIQKEIASLKDEVNRISTDTEFNGKKMLDGSLDRRSYVTSYDPDDPTAYGDSLFDKVSNVIISDEVQAGKYYLEITTAPEHAVVNAGAGAGAGGATVTAAEAGKVIINGVTAEIKEGMTPQEVYKTLQEAGSQGWVNVFARNDAAGQQITDKTLSTQGYTEIPYASFNQTLSFVSQKYGELETVTVSCDNPALRNLLGIGNDPNYAVDANGSITRKGVDVVASFEPTDAANILPEDYQQYSGQVIVTGTGDQIVITDKSGFEISVDVRADILIEIDATGTTATLLDQKELTIEATDIGTLQLQIGANEDQEMAVRVPILNTRSLYIDELDVTKIDGADRGMTEMDNAISIVSAARAKMGAYENRLDYAVKSLDETEEDMTTAISRLADVDMAEEMTTYTNSSVLTQASISVLAQANDLPQQVLSLLQG